jgi:hypothetical protein
MIHLLRSPSAGLFSFPRLVFPRLSSPHPYPSPFSMSTFTGSCHCSSVKYTLTVPPASDHTKSATRCNCTFCQKATFTALNISPEAFTLLEPKDRAELGDYSGGSRERGMEVHRWFCRECGVHLWREVRWPPFSPLSPLLFLPSKPKSHTLAQCTTRTANAPSSMFVLMLTKNPRANTRSKGKRTRSST